MAELDNFHFPYIIFLTVPATRAERQRTEAGHFIKDPQ